MIYELNAIFLACALEALVGDPEGWPHPVRGVGLIITRGEAVFRRVATSQRLAGVCFVAVVLAATVAPIVYLRSVLADQFGNGIFLFDGIVLFLSLSINQLVREGIAIADLLTAGDFEAARRNLARIVSRKTENLDGPDIAKSAIESVSENFADGFFNPFFYFMIAGPAGAVAYKVINTFDSMIGYRDQRYRDFGWAAARLDDLVNYVPARLAAWILVAAAPLAGLSLFGAATVLLRDGRKHESPNAGLGKAAVAGAVGVRLGGPVLYAAERKDRQYIGEPIRELSSSSIRDAVRHVVAAAVLSMIIFGAAAYLGAKF